MNDKKKINTSASNQSIQPNFFFPEEIFSLNFKLSQTTEKKEEYNSDIMKIPIIEEDSISREERSIIFKSKEDTLKMDMRTVLTYCPAVSKHKHLRNSEYVKEITINLPEWITAKNVSEFFIYIHDENYSNFTISVRKLLLISDYFDNQEIVGKVIKNEIIPYLNKENSLLFLEDSFVKLNNRSSNEAWFSLFYASLSSVAKNLIYYLENCYDKVKGVNKKILEEVIEKYFQLMHNNDCGSISSSALKLVINLLFDLRGTHNIYELIINEFYRINSNDTIEELSAIRPSLKVKLNASEITHLYKEYNDINLEKQSFTFIIYHKKVDNSLNLAYKINFPTKSNSNLKILTILAVTDFKQCENLKQTSTRIVSSHKNLNSIFSKSDFLNYFKDCLEINVKVYLRVCYTHSAIQHYYLLNFSSFYNDTMINKLTRNNLFAIFQNKYLKRNSEDEIVIAFCNWFVDEKNLSEDVMSVIEIISWKEVSLEVIFEFIIKFARIIDKYQLQGVFSKVIENKLSQASNSVKNIIDNVKKFLNQDKPDESNGIGNIIAKALFRSSKKVDFVNTYEKIFEILKNSKYNSHLNNTISSMIRIPSQVDSFQFKITPKKNFSENDQILTSDLFEKEGENKFSNKTLNKDNKSMRSIDSLNMISPHNISQKRSKEFYGEIIFQTGFSNISQISKTEFCDKKEDLLKDKDEFETINPVEPKQSLDPSIKKSKSKECSEASYKVNDTTGNSKNIEFNTLSGRVSTGRSWAKKFNEKKKMENSCNKKSKKNILEEHANLISPKLIQTNKFNLEYNHIPSEITLIESPSKKTPSNIKHYSILNNPNPKSITNNSNSTTINNDPIRKTKGTTKSSGIALIKGKALDKSNSVLRLNSTKNNNSISSPIAMKNNPKINDWLQVRKIKNQNSKTITQWKSLATSKSTSIYNVKAEEGLEMNKEIKERIKKIPNLKKTLEKSLKRPVSVAEYNK